MHVFFQVIILRPHPHFTRNVRKKNPQKHPHFTRLKIRRSLDPQIRILPEAYFVRIINSYDKHLFLGYRGRRGLHLSSQCDAMCAL